MNQISRKLGILLLGLSSFSASAVTVQMSPYATSGVTQMGSGPFVGFSYTMIAEFDPVGEDYNPGSGALRFHATSAEVIVGGISSFLTSSQLAQTWVTIQNSATSLGMYFNFAIPPSTGSSFVLGSFNVDWGINKPDIGTPGPEDLIYLSNSILASEAGPGDALTGAFTADNGPYFLFPVTEYGFGEISVIPEPSVPLLAVFGLVPCLRRRR